MIGYVGVPHGVQFDGQRLFFSQIGMRGGPAPVRRFLPHLMDLVLERKINPGKVFDLEPPLAEVADGYRAMDERRAIKTCSAFSWKPALSRAIDEVAAGIVLDVLTLMRGRECLAEIDKAAWALMRSQWGLSGFPFRSARCDGSHGATRGIVLNMRLTRPGGQEFSKCLIINGHMRCGSRFPLKQKRSFPILAVVPTLKLAGAPKKLAMTPWRGTGAL
jgi:hypothetical protein